MRAKFAISTVCYLIVNGRVLFLHFEKKWGKVSCPPGGKNESGETSTECIIREFKEETGLELINPRLKGISYWNWEEKEFGVIFVYIAEQYKGVLQRKTTEGTLEWININDMPKLKQFAMNEKFTGRVFQTGIFEGTFKLNEDNSVKEYKLRKL